MRVVVTHANSDLDALASVVAATKLYPGSIAVGGGSLSPPVQRFLALHKDHYPLVSPDEIAPEAVREVIVVDVRDRRRLREVAAIVEAAPRVVVWDHHPPTDFDVEAAEVTIEPIGACVTLLVERLIEDGIGFTADEATLFLLGLYADTGRLSYGTTRPRDIRVAAELLERGANLKVVNRYLRHTLSDEQTDLLMQMMATTRVISVDQVEIAIGTAVAARNTSGAAAVVQQVMELGGHDVMFGVLHFTKNRRVQIIGRSRLSHLNVAQALQNFGGGGHSGAGAAFVKNEEPAAVVERLEAILRASPMNPTRVAEIMSSPVHFLAHDLQLAEAAAALESWGISGAPVTRDGELCGIISRRDIARAARGGNLELPVGSHMAHHVATVDHHEPIEDVLEMMTAADIGRMPVTRNAEIVGIVTRTDLIRRLYMKGWDDTELLE